MADRVLFIGWGKVVRGREERSLEVFDEVVGYYGRCQQEGRIERFDVVLLAPSSELAGYIQIHGTAEQIVAVREDQEFLRNTVDATLCVEGLRHIEGFTNEGVARQMEMYQEAVARLPQMS
jgi:hypothetical protein